jgi:PAS domain S-box-containing protein
MKNRPRKAGMPLDANDLQEIVAHCDEEGIILSWNKAGEDITGFAEDDVLGYHVDTIVADASREDLHSLLGFERAGSTLPGMPMVLQTSFGMEVPVEVTLVPWVVGAKRRGSLLIFRRHPQGAAPGAARPDGHAVPRTGGGFTGHRLRPGREGAPALHQ